MYGLLAGFELTLHSSYSIAISVNCDLPSARTDPWWSYAMANVSTQDVFEEHHPVDLQAARVLHGDGCSRDQILDARRFVRLKFVCVWIPRRQQRDVPFNAPPVRICDRAIQPGRALIQVRLTASTAGESGNSVVRRQLATGAQERYPRHLHCGEPCPASCPLSPRIAVSCRHLQPRRGVGQGVVAAP